MRPSHPLSGHPAFSKRGINRQLEAELISSFPGATLCSPCPTPQQRLSALQCLKISPPAKREKLQSPCSESQPYVLHFLLHRKCFSNQISWRWRFVYKCFWTWGWFLLHLIPNAVIQHKRFPVRAGRLLESLPPLTAYCLVGVTLQNKPKLWTLW